MTLFLSHVLLLTVQRKLGSPSAALKLIPALRPINLLLAGIAAVLSFLWVSERWDKTLCR